MENYLGKSFETVLAWVEDGIGYLQFNRPKAMNSVNKQVLIDALEVLDAFSVDAEVRAIILTGNEKAFCAGADLAAAKNMNAFEARDFLDGVHKVMFAIEDNHKPVIAAINGLALGGGFEIVLASDIRIAADNATFGLPEISLGIFPGAGGTQRWTRSGSICHAKQYILTGDFFDAATAYRMDMINMIVPANEVMDAAKKMAKKISKKSPLAIREAKLAINRAMSTDIKTGCRSEQIAWAMLFSSDDQKEGMGAFLEGRKAEFKGK
ncbi:MAG: enoyl-CoA hydratase/isomerase family protein [Solirubrobacterales bacterium]